MSCQKQPYRHDDGNTYADADSCSGCCLNRTHECDGWRTQKPRNKRARRVASLKPKRR